jgi:uncharacterized protein (TIRG00374 family)
MKKGSIRIIVICAIFVVALAVVILRGSTFGELVDSMRRGIPQLLILAFLSQFCKYIAQSFGYSFGFRAIANRDMKPYRCFPLVFGAFFMNTIAPSLNIAGNSLFIEDARKRGEKPGRATTACLIMQTSIETGFLVIMIAGFTVMAISGDLTLIMVLFGLVVLVLVGAMGGSVILSYKSPSTLTKILDPLERIANWFWRKLRKKELPKWSAMAADALGDGAGEAVQRKGRIVSVFGCSVLASSFELGCFILTGFAFGAQNIPALLGGYVICVLFTMVAITPMGLGVVEPAIAIVMNAYGVPMGTAMTVSLVFRGITFWLPFILGTILINCTKAFKKGEPQKALEQVQKVEEIVVGSTAVPSTGPAAVTSPVSSPEAQAEEPKKPAEAAVEIPSEPLWKPPKDSHLA